MKNRVGILIIGLFFIFLGVIFAIPEVLRMHTRENIQEDYEFQKSSYIYHIDGKKKIYFKDAEVFYEELGDNMIIIDTYYYQPFIEGIEVKAKNCNHNICLVIKPNYHISWDDIKAVHDRMTQELKKENMYDYRRLYQPKIIVRVNQKYKHLIEIDD